MNFEQMPKPEPKKPSLPEVSKNEKEATLIEQHKAAIQKGREKLLREEWEKIKEAKKEEQKSQARAILRKFFEKEEEKKKEILIDVAEQEKLIEEALKEKEELPKEETEESLKTTKEELLKSKELNLEEKNYLEKNELTDQRETELLASAKKWEAVAEENLKECEKIRQQLEEKGIDVDKLGISLKERIKFSLKSLFDRNLKNLQIKHDKALVWAAVAKDEAQLLRLAATEPKKYLEWLAEYTNQKKARRAAEKAKRLKKKFPERIGLSFFEAKF